MIKIFCVFPCEPIIRFIEEHPKKMNVFHDLPFFIKNDHALVNFNKDAKYYNDNGVSYSDILYEQDKSDDINYITIAEKFDINDTNVKVENRYNNILAQADSNTPNILVFDMKDHCNLLKRLQEDKNIKLYITKHNNCYESLQKSMYCCFPELNPDYLKRKAHGSNDQPATKVITVEVEQLSQNHSNAY